MSAVAAPLAGESLVVRVASETALVGASAWERFWYGPESRANLRAARIVLAGTALWIVLSRFDLPSILAYPPELWRFVPWERRLRFGMVFGLATERWLYAGLHVSLMAALLGLWPRVTCLLSGLLLYHFAPFETVIRTPNPYLRGLTVPALGLLVLSFAAWAERPRVEGATAEAPSAWPLRLVQVLFCQIYLFAGYSKLFWTGLAWTSGANMRGHLLVLNQALAIPLGASIGYDLAAHPALCGLLGVAGLVFELAFPLVLFVPVLRAPLLVLAVAFHLANVAVFHIAFQDLPLLLLFVDWSRWGGPRD